MSSSQQLANELPQAPIRTSRLPRQARFPLLVIISLFAHSILLQASGIDAESALGAISRQQNELWQPIAYLSYKIFVLYVGWALNYDFIDISALTLLTNAPYAYLIDTFYAVPHTTTALKVGFDIISTALPTYLLRPRSQLHNPSTPVPNRFLLNSFKVEASTMALSVAVYVITIWASIKVGEKEGRVGLTTLMASNFEIRTYDLAWADLKTFYPLIAKLFFVGVAAQTFMFSPSLGAQTSLADATSSVWNPATASLTETVEHNVWSWSKRVKVLLTQTVAVVLFTVLNTVIKSSTIEGATVAGGLGYAGVWTAAHLTAAAMFAWVGDSEDPLEKIE